MMILIQNIRALLIKYGKGSIMDSRKTLQDKIRKKLKSGDVVIGTWQQIPDPSISEILAESGYDWIAIDLEHGSIGISHLPNLIRSIENYNCLPIVRVADPSPQNCKQALDAGSGGVIIPMIKSANQLNELIQECFWPPKGIRGVGYSRANLFGKNFNNYYDEAQNPIIISQIEHIDAVKNLDQILSIKYLDGIMVGPYDLSASMKITGDFSNPDFVTVMNEILAKCKNHNIPCGDHIVIPDEKLLKKRVEDGYNFIAYGTDGVFLFTSCMKPRLN